MSVAKGDSLGGRYELTDRIAAGGMGEVWKATDGILGRTVAVKVLKQGLSDEEGFTERFRNEARLSASVSDHNIAAVYDYGETDGKAFLVMEYVPGQPVSKVIHDHAPLTAIDTCTILKQAAHALAAAHKAGLIHRDIKPANILIDPEGVAKLTDFGISRAVGQASMTRAGEVMGTPQYLAPEQALGRPATAQSDLYALGIVGFECLAGRRPFDKETSVATALAHVNEPVPPLPGHVPPPLRDLLQAMLSKEPERRPQSAREIAKAIESCERYIEREQDRMRVQGHQQQIPENLDMLRQTGPGTHPGPVSGGQRVGPPSGPQSGTHPGPVSGGQRMGPPSGPQSGTHPGPSSGGQRLGPPSGPQTGTRPGSQTGPDSGPQRLGGQPSGPQHLTPDSGARTFSGTVQRPGRRIKPWWIGVAAAVLLAVVAGLVLLFQGGDDAPADGVVLIPPPAQGTQYNPDDIRRVAN